MPRRLPAETARSPLLEPLEPRVFLAGDLDFVLRIAGGVGLYGIKGVGLDGAGNVRVEGVIQGQVDLDPGPGTSLVGTAGADSLVVATYSPAGAFLGGWALECKTGDTDYFEAASASWDADGNLYLAGSLRGTMDFDPGPGTVDLVGDAGHPDGFVSKYDASGGLVWARLFASDTSAECRAVAVDSLGNVYTIGTCNGTTDLDPSGATYNITASAATTFISKLDSGGDFAWAKEIAGDVYAFTAAAAPGGDLVIAGIFQQSDTPVDFDPGAGTTNLTNAGGYDVFVARFTGAGDLEWAKAVGGTEFDGAYGLAVDEAGGIDVAGHFAGTADFDPGGATFTLTSAGEYDVFVVKLDGSGNFSWAGRMGGAGSEMLNCLAIDAAHNVYVGGTYASEDADFDPGPGIRNLPYTPQTPGFVAKLDSGGGFVWVRGLAARGADSSSSDGAWPGGLAANALGDVFVAGDFSGTVDFDPGPAAWNLTAAPGNGDGFVMKLTGPGDDRSAPRVLLANPADGSSVDRDRLNAQKYLDITFGDAGGIYPKSITDTAREFTLGGLAAALVKVGAPRLVSGTTYRYTFTGAFGAGPVSVDFAAGALADAAGNANPALSPSFTVTADATPPTAAIANPAGGGTIDRDILNARKYLEITFSDPGGVNSKSILDTAQEFTLGGPAAALVKVGAPRLVSGTTYRYAFTGNFGQGAVTVNFAAGSFADTAGHLSAAAAPSFTVSVDTSKPTASPYYPSSAGSIDIDILNDFGYLYVRFADGVALNPATITDAAPEFTLSGTGAGAVKIGAPKLVGGSTYRYPFTGNFAAGGVTLDFPAGAFADLAGSLSDAATDTFTVSAATGLRFGMTGGRKNVVLYLDDADGTHVKYAMTGQGFGEVDAQGGQTGVYVAAMAAGSAVTITTAKSASPADDGEVNFAWLQVDGVLGRLTAKTANLASAQAWISGQMGALTLDDVTGTAIELEGSDMGSGGPAFVFDQVSDSDISSQYAPLKSLTVTEWLDSGVGGYVGVPRLGSLSVRGRAANAAKQTTVLAGDFEIRLYAVGQDAKGRSVGTISVAGTISSPEMQVAGSAGSITAAKWTGTAMTARSVGAVTVKGDMTNVTMILSQAPDPKVKALGTLAVGGKMDACTIDAAGHVGKATVGALLASTVKAGDMAGPVDMQAALGSLTVKGLAGVTDAVVGSSISAWTLGTVVLRDVEMSNSGAPFGVTGHALGAYTRYAGGVVARKAAGLIGPLATPVDAEVDFSVTLV